MYATGQQSYRERHLLCRRAAHLELVFFFFNDTATTEIYTLSLHDALPILIADESMPPERDTPTGTSLRRCSLMLCSKRDRKSTRLNSSHSQYRMPSSA